MWCFHNKKDVNCNGYCSNCVLFSPTSFQSNYNYKCPDCNGEFNTPSTPGITSSLYYKCPFCGRIMEGM